MNPIILVFVLGCAPEPEMNVFTTSNGLTTITVFFEEGSFSGTAGPGFEYRHDGARLAFRLIDITAESGPGVRWNEDGITGRWTGQRGEVASIVCTPARALAGCERSLDRVSTSGGVFETEIKPVKVESDGRVRPQP